MILNKMYKFHQNIIISSKVHVRQYFFLVVQKLRFFSFCDPFSFFELPVRSLDVLREKSKYTQDWKRRKKGKVAWEIPQEKGRDENKVERKSYRTNWMPWSRTEEKIKIEKINSKLLWAEAQIESKLRQIIIHKQTVI